MKVRCQKCNYIWEYKGSLLRATCPNCGTTVMVEKNKLIADICRQSSSERFAEFVKNKEKQ